MGDEIDIDVPPAEMAAMNDIQDRIFDACTEHTDVLVFGQVINAVSSALSHLISIAVLGPDALGEDAETFSAFRGEAAKRLMDAGFSMEDYKARKMPWRPQSSAMKRGAAVARIKTGSVQ